MLIIIEIAITRYSAHESWAWICMDSSYFATCVFSWDGSKDGLTLGVWGCSVSSEASLTPRSGSWSFFAPLGVSWNIFTWPICVATWLPRGIMAWLNVNIQRAQREIDGILMTLLHKSRSITSALCTEILRVSNIMPRKAASDMIYSTWVFCCCFLFITLENY